LGKLDKDWGLVPAVLRLYGLRGRVSYRRQETLFLRDYPSTVTRDTLLLYEGERGV